MPLQTEIIHLAPLQGFTDFIYRECYHQFWGSVNLYYIPYLSIGPGRKIRNSQKKDVLRVNNQDVPVVPQLLVANVNELTALMEEVMENGYDQVNLNLGCPYPMATKKGRGAGLLENSDQLKAVVDTLFKKYSLKVSVKLRSGLHNSQTCLEQVQLLNDYPFEKIIFHPRTVGQLYKGIVDLPLFEQFRESSRHPVVYNGDIFSLDDFKKLKQQFPDQQEWMLGRGILMNPFLPHLIKGGDNPGLAKYERLMEFHDLIIKRYHEALDTDGHVLNKMQQFWIYFSSSFSNPHKALKMIKKARSCEEYLEKVHLIFNQFVIDP